MRRAPLLFLLAALVAPAIPGSGSAASRGAGGLGAPLWERADQGSRARVQEWVDRASSGWSPNRGQVADVEGRVATDVLYWTRARDARVYVTRTGLRYFFFATGEEAESEHRPGGERDEGPRKFEWSRVDLRLEGAEIRAEHARPGRAIAERGLENFYLPHCPRGVLGVPAFAEVEFPEVYPGIDWILRGDPGSPVHQDFVVRPGADPSAIRFTYEGARSVEVTGDGQSLRVTTALGEVREGALRCTQANGTRVVGARFVRDGNAITIRLDDYARTEPLVIDPPIVWSTYYGDDDYDGSLSMVADNANQTLYVVGYTASANLPTFNGGGYYDGVYDGNVDGVIWKFSQLGVRQWATFYGGTNYDACNDVAIDGLGNLYVCGETGSSDLPTLFLGGAYNANSLGGLSDGFVLKFNGLGAMQWGTYFGGSNDEAANSVCTDATGKVYVCGRTTSIDLPLQDPGGGAYYDNTFDPSDDAWVARFGTLNALEWSTYLGGDNTENAMGITAGAGNLYVVGYTWSSDFPLANPGGGAYYQSSLVGQQDAFITRFTLAGVLTWGTYLGGDEWDSANEPLLRPGGNLIVSGETRSTDIPTWDPGGGAFYDNAVNGFSFDFYLAEFSPAAVPIWGTYLGGSADENFERPVAKSIALDSAGRLYFTARTTSSDYPTVNLAGSFFDNSWGGSTDAVIARFGANRSLQWSTYFGTAFTDFGTGIAVGVGDCMFATGEAWGNGITTVDPGLSAYYDATNNGVDDVYFAKFCTPNSACCIDNNCQPAASQSECFGMGGTAFYPGQPCSTVVCTILCTICGRKFEDLNRNGVQDGGEPALAGWTIVLSYPNGPVYATAVTNAQGEYCFNAIPCGTWEVSEQHQPGWVQTWPTTNAHTVTLGTGTTQNGVNFGNVQCGSGVPCIPSPTWLAAWWPFGDGVGAPLALDVTHPDPARNSAVLQGGAVFDTAAICFTSAADGAVVPDAAQLGLDFDSGSFSIAAWVRAAPGAANPRTIVDKRAPFGVPGNMRGWSLALNGLQSVLEIGTGGSPQVTPGPDVTADEWTHLAVAVDRAGGHGRWFLNGTPAAAFDFTPITGDVTNDADVSIGKGNPGFGPGAGFDGCIADLSVFGAALSAADASKAWIPGPIGFCPEYALIPQITKFCQGQTTRQVCFNIANNHATPQTYHWSLAGLPANPPGCTHAGPTLFSPSSGTVTVAAGGISPAICVTITRPPGFTAQNATSCFDLSFVNAATGKCQKRTSKLRVDNSCWCVTPPPGAQNVAARVPAGTVIGIPVENPCDPIALLAYRMVPVWLDPEHPDPVALSLDGLPPGMPVEGELDASSGVPPTLEVVARYPKGYDPAAIYEIAIEADTDGDGTPERLGGVMVRPTYETTQNTGVPGETIAGIPAGLRARPNPFFARSNIELALPRAENIDLAVYDLGGRLVRSLARGRFEAGPRTFVWDGYGADGRRAAAGIYFVRCLGGGRSLEAKLVKLR